MLKWFKILGHLLKCNVSVSSGYDYHQILLVFDKGTV
jgi:hypothetical protein